MAVNINRDVKDAFFRYKMPRLLAKVEGSGNGIKTVVPNMADIGKSLARPPSYPTKFFGIELGAQTQMDDAASRYIVNGAHNAEDLAKLLDRFIKKFVLCHKCGNPETDMLIDKKQQITLKCKACGHVSRVDMTHKLITFILNHPPNGAVVDGKGGKKTKEERRKEKAERARSGQSSTKNSDDEADAGEEPSDDSGMQFTPVITVAAGEPTVVHDAPERTSTPLGAKSPSNGAEDDDDAAFTVDEETLRRARESEIGSLSDNVKRAMNIDDKSADKKGEADMYDAFAAYLTSNTPTAEGIKQEIRFLDDEKSMAVLAQVLFDENVLKQLEQYKPVLCKVVTSEKAQKGLLGGLERLVGLTQPKLMPKIPHILKWCYDNDVLPEEAILVWGKKPSKKYLEKEVAATVRQHAQPILQWLETAEEESDEEDDE